MGKTKVECKKLDYLTETQKCFFCGTSEIDEMKYGPVYVHKNIITHYYCLLLSSNMEQNGRDSDGILGFLPNDISREVKRGSRLHCSYCRSNGATLGCVITKCKVVFHLPCGMKHSTLHQFFGEFKSFCNKHRPVQIISEKILANSSKGAICGICYDKVVPRPVHETLWAPCCQKNAFFHRVCVQRLAISAGYFFKCPLCNNTTLFQQTMKEFGIYIPEQDASWECVPHAYQDLLVRHDSCDSANCSCPEGRKTNVPGTRWELILCKYCGSQGIHIGCGRLKWKSPEFECDICSKSTPQSEDGNLRSNSGSRHRLLESNGAANVHPSVSADRFSDQEDNDESSSDSVPLTISNRRMRIISPVPELRSNTPTLHKSSKKHRHERYEKNHDFEKKHDINSCIVIDDDLEEKLVSRSILIDDSDDDVEFVNEPKFNFNQSKGTSLKTVDGMTIPVVQVDSKAGQVRKRFRAVGDIDIDTAEVVDISIQMSGPVKKPKIPSPPPIKEVVYSFSQLQPQPSTSHSVPSTSFAPSDFSRFLLVDSSTLRPEDLVPGTVVYRSIQPLMQPIPQQAQPPPQLQPQTSSMPMQQQLGPTCHADAQYSDLSKHWAGSSYHLSSYTDTHHVQKYSKKASRRTVKCDNPGRRRGRHPRCDNNRLNPQVVISRLTYRISSNGHVEFIVPWENLNSHILKKKAAVPSRPMKKIKLSSNKNSSKCKLLEKAIPPLTITTFSEKREKKILKIKRKTQSKQTIKVKIPSHTNREITNYYIPNKLKTNKKRKDKKCDITIEITGSIDNSSSKTDSKERKIKKRKLNLLKQWECNTIDKYLKTFKKSSTFQSDTTNQQISLDDFDSFEQNKPSFVVVKPKEHDNVVDSILNASKKESLIPEVNFDDTMFSSNKFQDHSNLNCNELSSKHFNETDMENINHELVLNSSKKEFLISEVSYNNSTKTFENETKKYEMNSNLNLTESSFTHSNKSDLDEIENLPFNSFKTELPSVHNTMFVTNKFQDNKLQYEQHSLDWTDSIYKYSTIPIHNGTSLDNKEQVLSKALLKFGFDNTKMIDSEFGNIYNSFPPKVDLKLTAGYSTKLTNSNIANSLCSWKESNCSLLSNALEIGTFLGEGSILSKVSEAKDDLETMKSNDTFFGNYHISLVPKSFDEPLTSNDIKSIDNKNILLPKEVEKYVNKETENGLPINIVDVLDSSMDIKQDVLKNQKPSSYGPQLSHYDSATEVVCVSQIISSCKAATYSRTVKDSLNDLLSDANSCSIVEIDRPCGEVSQGKNFSNNETASKANASNELIGVAGPNCGNSNNYQKQASNSLFRIKGFFPKIKLGKSTKSKLSNKSCSSSKMKLKHSSDDKRGRKLYKENIKQFKLHKKEYKFDSNGMYSLDRFFILNSNELSSTSKPANNQHSPEKSTIRDETSNTVNSMTGSPTKSGQIPLFELKLNEISNLY